MHRLSTRSENPQRVVRDDDANMYAAANSIKDYYERTQRKTVTLRNLRRKIGPIIYNILDYLSATDASLFMHTMMMRVTDGHMNKYINILRDIPEHQDWIDDMLKEGHKVMLIGEDLNEFGNRIMNPGKRDRKNERKLCIWLAVVPVHAVVYNETNWQRFMDEGDGYIVTGRGALVRVGPEQEYVLSNPPRFLMRAGGNNDHAEMIDNKIVRSMFLFHSPVTLISTTLPHFQPWVKSFYINNNNISVMFYRSEYADLSTPLTVSLDTIPTGLTLIPEFSHVGAREGVLNSMSNTVTGVDVMGDRPWPVPLMRIKRSDDDTSRCSSTSAYYDVNKGEFMRMAGNTGSYPAAYAVNMTKKGKYSIVIKGDVPRHGRDEPVDPIIIPCFDTNTYPE